jgi:hypothetical protein
MFNLNEAVEKWRRDCADQQTFTGGDLEELEGHLREETDHLILAGLSEEEAFLVAVRRLGDTQSLGWSSARSTAARSGRYGCSGCWRASSS